MFIVREEKEEGGHKRGFDTAGVESVETYNLLQLRLDLDMQVPAGATPYKHETRQFALYVVMNEMPPRFRFSYLNIFPIS